MCSTNHAARILTVSGNDFDNDKKVTGAFDWLSDDHPAPRLGPPAPQMPSQQQQQAAATPLPPAPDWSSEALLNARKRARSLLSAAGGAGDLTRASSGATMAKATLGA